ncbi:MAG: hypothetical protein ACRCWB_03425 [Enterovibrio sp.]
MAYIVLSELFPAPAGMSRILSLLIFYFPSVPRASGDEPESIESAGDLVDCSPRQRG